MNARTWRHKTLYLSDIKHGCWVTLSCAFFSHLNDVRRKYIKIVKFDI